MEWNTEENFRMEWKNLRKEWRWNGRKSPVWNNEKSPSVPYHALAVKFFCLVQLKKSQKEHRHRLLVQQWW